MTSKPGIPIMNMNPPSGLVVRVRLPGSAWFSFSKVEVMICFLTVLRPMLAKSTRRIVITTTEVKPPVVVVY